MWLNFAGEHQPLHLHRMNAPPKDQYLNGIIPCIAQLENDTNHGSTFQLVLVDVEFHNSFPSLAPEMTRTVQFLGREAQFVFAWIYQLLQVRQGHVLDVEEWVFDSSPGSKPHRATSWG